MYESGKYGRKGEIRDSLLAGCYRQTYCELQTALTFLTQWSESASELYRSSDRRLSAKLEPTFTDRRCHVVSVTDPCGRILGFLDRSRYFFFQVAP
jgi:hypothetical protein